MKKISVSKARNGLYKLIEEISKDNKPVFIDSKNWNAVFISEKGWEQIVKRANNLNK